MGGGGGGGGGPPPPGNTFFFSRTQKIFDNSFGLFKASSLLKISPTNFFRFYISGVLFYTFPWARHGCKITQTLSFDTETGKNFEIRLFATRMIRCTRERFAEIFTSLCR